ncbi:aminotransferase class I/II-fold pyridoxal phosphate-dependent enzyme [Fulvivirga sp. 29W222]|uniref:Aminotransferase class I/II-fold pyridoxal phosphate-dependent enzyme n=1 Tax=Fulvivirga marina TaxID=2494733 RepID=A0A937FT54_9BACT|nr:methionine aminotransferase [Fulvivirga marina]MBL6444939.1 aminotransferase class I/II-fold pyridoxal phosphate-dependent enzyme [Fulvivirga marina]
MPKLKSKLPDVGTSIFTVMSKMAQEHSAINLSQGFPDFEVSKELIGLVNKYMSNGFNQYAPMPGVPALREQIGVMLKSRFNYYADPDTEITITSGATEALFNTITALISPDDEVILFDPAYDSYAPVIRLSGGIPMHLTLKQPDFSINWDEVEQKVTSQTRMIIINTPHNPTGSILTGEDMRRLDKIAMQHPNLLILSDEVYEHIIFDNFTHASVLRYPALADQSIAVFSFGKTFHATGWKVGYVVAPADIMAEIRKVHQFVTFSVNTAVQLAIAEYLKTESNYTQLPAFYQQKRDLFLGQIKDSGFIPIPCHGTYFQSLSYQEISNRPDMEMAEYLTKTHSIASIPISAFYKNRRDDKILRFCFAKNEETIEKAAKILCRI